MKTQLSDILKRFEEKVTVGRGLVKTTGAVKVEILPLSHDGLEDEDEDEDDFDTYEVMDQVENIFKKCRINLARDREITLFARMGDIVVGGIASSYSNGTDYEDDYIKYTFDIAVDPAYQNSTVGYLLMEAAIQQGASLGDGEIPVLCKNWVVNPVAKNMLEKFFGFEETADHGDNNWHLEKWF